MGETQTPRAAILIAEGEELIANLKRDLAKAEWVVNTYRNETLGWDRLMTPPTPIELVRELHEAVHGSSWARPDSPQAVWNELLAEVRARVGGVS